jgi:Fur family ferric uptake transcriptional regulator
MTPNEVPDPHDTGRHHAVHATRQRRAVLHALAESEGFVSAQQLHARMLLDGQRVGLNTIYRALNAFADTGWVDVVRHPAGEQLFRLRPGPRHEHYLLCRRCGHSVAVTSELVEQWAETVGQQHGFSDVHHVIELTGICPDCART